jgi:hypothetical protein
MGLIKRVRRWFAPPEDPKPSDDLERGLEDMRTALMREAAARSRLVDSATREKAHARRVAHVADEAIRLAQWPWEKQEHDKASR